MSAERIAEAVGAYRANPGSAELASLCHAFADATLYVPVGDFDGRNAAIPSIRAEEGGEFIPVYTEESLVPGGDASEGIRPADWRHILDQLPHITGYAVNPQSLNFAFTRDFLDVLLSEGAEDGAGDGGALGEDAGKEGGGAGEAQEHAGQSTENAGAPADDMARAGEESGAPGGAQSTLAAEETPDGTYFHIGVPAAVPSSLREAMQAVADRTGRDVWLLLVVPSHGEESYLMVIDGPEDWFAISGTHEVNSVLGGFPDPGRPLDFVTRTSELGQFVEGKEPHYRPLHAGDGSQPSRASGSEGAQASSAARGEEGLGRAANGADASTFAERAQDYAARAKDVGGQVAGQARERASEFGAQMKGRFEDAQANSEDTRGFFRRFFGRE